jgi:hypothetical protein
MIKAGIAKFNANQMPNIFAKINMAVNGQQRPEVPVVRSGPRAH